MPTYQYACDACGHEFEREQRISEDAIKKCAKCGKNKARRMIVSSNFILKGGGWYSDGYGASGGDSKKKTGDSGSASSTPSTPAPSSTATDAKPAAGSSADPKPSGSSSAPAT